MFYKKLEDIFGGDSGLLASELIDRRVAKLYKVGVVPHYMDRKYLEHDKIETTSMVTIDVTSKITR